MSVVLDEPQVEAPSKISTMREIESRKVSEGHGVDYELVVLWDPADGKVYVAKVIDDIEPQTVLEIDPAKVNYHLDHPALICFP